ncbi:hypothetical protein D9613_012672 [Agrocybe pediades]|uniref:Uncharacterized protein n=1 Tax=Agrocybe pediades TaxID=84607 RepID=A0A8H4QV38_9AGAR|nr:hypothetical protein D9613_012672 [Agrocybe pediades]
MSTGSDDFPFSVAQQKALIGAGLHASLLAQFLFGIYTGVLGGPLHKGNRSASKDRIVIGSITALYAVTLLNILISWIYTSVLLCTTGGTLVEVFIASVIEDYMPTSVHVLLDVVEFLGYVIADGLLVWRCFQVYGRDLSSNWLPIGLLVLEISLCITSSVYTCVIRLQPNPPTPHISKINDDINAVANASVGVTSVVATFMICRKVYMHTESGSRSRKRYQNVLNALIQSSAVYSVTMLCMAIFGFLDTGFIESSLTVVEISEYLGCFSILVGGLAPTLMIGRLSISPREDTEMSSARLPSDLMPCASQLAGSMKVNISQGDVDKHESGSPGVEHAHIMEVDRIQSNA